MLTWLRTFRDTLISILVFVNGNSCLCKYLYIYVWVPAGRTGDFGNFFNVFVKSPLLPLLYIQLTISFLIGRKRTVNFRNQRLEHHLAADYTMIMSRTLEVTGNHVMYDRGALFRRVIMWSSRALCCLPSVKKQRHDFHVCFVYRLRHRENS